MRTRRFSPLAAVLGLAFSIAALTGCEPADASEPIQNDWAVPMVVTDVESVTLGPLVNDFARVKFLIPTGATIHAVELTPLPAESAKPAPQTWKAVMYYTANFTGGTVERWVLAVRPPTLQNAPFGPFIGVSDGLVLWDEGETVPEPGG